MNPVRAYDYLMLARAKLFDWIRPLSQERYTQEFPFGLHTLRATMVEIAGGEWIYARRLRGESIPPEAEWPIRGTRGSRRGGWAAIQYRRRRSGRSEGPGDRVPRGPAGQDDRRGGDHRRHRHPAVLPRDSPPGAGDGDAAPTERARPGPRLLPPDVPAGRGARLTRSRPGRFATGRVCLGAEQSLVEHKSARPPDWVSQVASLVALAVALYYLTWRLLFTFNKAALWLAIPVWAAELYGG